MRLAGHCAALIAGSGATWEHMTVFYWQKLIFSASELVLCR